MSKHTKMKKILLSILPLLVVSFIANAQLTYTISTDTAYLSLADDAVPHKAKFNIANGATATTFEWRLVQVNKPSDWVAPGVCDWKDCYLFTDYSWHTAPVLANATHDLFIDMRRPVGASQGCSQVGIEYRELGSATNYQVLRHASGADLTACASLWPTATSDVSKNPVVTVYPNPTTNLIKLNVINKDVKAVIISSIIGKQIQHLDISNSNGSQHQLSLQALPNGIYMLQFKNESGKVLGVTRVTKQ